MVNGTPKISPVVVSVFGFVEALSLSLSLSLFLSRPFVGAFSRANQPIVAGAIALVSSASRRFSRGRYIPTPVGGATRSSKHSDERREKYGAANHRTVAHSHGLLPLSAASVSCAAYTSLGSNRWTCARIPAGRRIHCTPRLVTYVYVHEGRTNPRRAVRTINSRLASDIMHLVYGNAKQRFTEPRNCSLWWIPGIGPWEEDAAKGIRDIEDFRFGKTVAYDESPRRSGEYWERERGFKICRLGRFRATCWWDELDS